MNIVPVIDLKGGQAVHARLGERGSYRPVRSRLCPSADRLAGVGAFRALHAFDTVYVADLDAIQGDGDNGPVLERLRAAFPDLTLWVDGGLSDPAACRAWLRRGLGDLVLGSESQSDMTTFEGLRAETAIRERVILSLDFRGDRFLGPQAFCEDAARWPERVIVMTLARVGSERGPDLDLLRTMRAQAPGVHLFAAGGVRGPEDLAQLAQEGISGALVASALHDGRIDGPAIARLRVTGVHSDG
jgi:phosphoribosylformimino-5-aminoimidazole carboxamide ribotide isomerase